jgi:polysaccharide pyruvyl transferase WcaK-like protein
MAAGTPAFAISYFSTKSSGVMESIGEEEAWCEYNAFRAELVLSRLDDLVSNANRARIEARVRQFRCALRNEVAGWDVCKAEELIS